MSASSLRKVRILTCSCPDTTGNDIHKQLEP